MAKNIQWKGYYVEQGQRVPMTFQNLVFQESGQISGEGTNNSGPYTIQGNALINGDFNFRLISQSGAPNKQFEGQVLGDGTLRGKFVTPGYSATMFELKTRMDHWTGTYIQNGNKNELKLNFYSGTCIFGVGRDTTGLFVITGTVNTSNYQVEFLKSYPSKYSVSYNGRMVNNGIFWVINGTWSIGSNTTGQFEIFKEAPNSQKFQPNMAPAPVMGGGFGRPPMGGMPGQPMMMQQPMMGQQQMMMGGQQMMMQQPMMGQQQMMGGQQMMMGQQQMMGGQQMMMQQPMMGGQQMMMQPGQGQPQGGAMKPVISKYLLPSYGKREDIDELLTTLSSKGMMIEGASVASYIKKIPYEKDVNYFVEKIEPYLVSCTAEDVVETMKRTIFIRSKIKAAKAMLKKVGNLDDRDKKKVLDVIVFVDEKADLERYINNGFVEA